MIPESKQSRISRHAAGFIDALLEYDERTRLAWLLYLLEVLRERSDRAEYDALLQDLRAVVDGRLRGGHW